MIEILLGLLAAVILSAFGFILGRRKNDSEIANNNANAEKSLAEAEKLDTENKVLQVDLFDKLNNSLVKQNKLLLDSNEKLFKSNEKLVRSNEIILSQNKSLIKQMVVFEERVSVLEEELKATKCSNAEICENRNKLKQ